tara:strand:- start:179 stop:1321 length:1143 start_codon:yes stop_codon:yes gene_type:complete
MMMAFKKYAYYLQGNKLAIVESESRSSSGFKAVAHCTIGGHTTKDACEAAGGQWVPSNSGSSIGSFEEWQSPLEDITDGLEIEYAYSPTYWVSDELRNMQNKFYINGWTVRDGYLTFIRSHVGSTVANWTSSPYNAVGADEHILIKGSDRWNGLHKIKNAWTQGMLQTYTKVHEAEIGVTGSNNIDFAAEATVDGVSLSKIVANNNSNIFLGNIFSAGDYIAIDNGDAKNVGLWKVHKAVTEDNATTESDSYIYIKNKYIVPLDLDKANGITSVEVEVEDTTPDTNAHDNSSAFISKAYRDHCYLVSDVNVMEDEDFDIDLDSYLCKAIVYYLKGRVAEDSMDIEAKEYFMKEFHKMIDKHDSRLITAVRKIQAPIVGVR